jgi:hypothetical protein
MSVRDNRTTDNICIIETTIERYVRDKETQELNNGF